MPLIKKMGRKENEDERCFQTTLNTMKNFIMHENHQQAKSC